MRDPVDAGRIRAFMRELGRRATAPGRVYLTGGATAVLHGWRTATIDIDIKAVPDTDAILRALPGIKEALHVNVELAAPLDFIPVRDGWADRSPFIATEGRLSFHHFDLDAQALAKIERGHATDITDVEAMLDRGLIDAESLLRTFSEIEAHLHRYPAVDPPAFRAAVAEAVAAYRRRRSPE